MVNHPYNTFANPGGCFIRFSKTNNVGTSWANYPIAPATKFITTLTCLTDNPYLWIFPNNKSTGFRHSNACYIKNISVREILNTVGTEFAINDMSIVYRSKSVR